MLRCHQENGGPIYECFLETMAPSYGSDQNKLSQIVSNKANACLWPESIARDFLTYFKICRRETREKMSVDVLQ
jgi:hypothetical protein